MLYRLIIKKVMDVTIKINYTWTCDSGIAIPEKHKEALSEDAMSRIFEMRSEGYSSGELSTFVRFGKNEGPEEDEEGLSYTGWWSINTQEE